MKLIKKTIVALVSLITIACAQSALAEPPDTKWTVSEPVSSTVTITEEIESGTPWIFTLTKSDGKLARSQSGTTTKLNFRTLDLPNGYAIKNTGEAFKSRDAIVEVYWPNTLTTIAKNAFLNCSNLTICDVPEDAKMISIGATAFQGAKLKSFRMCDTVTSIGQNAFYKNKNLIFEGPMLPNDMTRLTARSISSIDGKPLKDGLLVVGGSGKPFTWVPSTSSGYESNHNK